LKHDKTKKDNHAPGGSTSANYAEPSHNKNKKKKEPKAKTTLVEKKCHTIKEEKDEDGVNYTIRCENPKKTTQKAEVVNSKKKEGQ
jgi:hypothetical protein